MAGTKTKKKISSLIVVLLATGIIVVVNMFSQRHFFRIDLTEEKQYTLSEASKTAVRSLSDTLTVSVYISKALPPNLLPLKQGVVDLLEEYQSYSRNRLRLRFIDPGDDEELKQELLRLGVREGMWRVIQKDKMETVRGYFGMALRYKDREEGIPIIGRLDTFEYTMTATILKVSAPEVITIGFLTGHEEYDLYVELGPLNDVLEKQYQVKVVNLAQGGRVPPDVNTLVIARPAKEIPEWELFAIDQFLVGGGGLVILIDPFKMKKNQLWADPIDTGLDDMLAHYGLKLQPDLVLDRYNKTASFNMGRGMFMSLPYPFWLNVIRANMDKENPALTNVDNLLLPWSGWMEVDENLPEGTEVSKLLRSSEFSWTQPYFNLNPQQQFQPDAGSTKSRTVAARISGKFNSFFKGREIPAKPAGDTSAPAPPPFPENERLDEGVTPGALILVANARFVTGEFLRMSPVNILFLLNSIDQMAYGDTLISLRARGLKPHLIDQEIDDKRKSRIKLFNFFGMPVAVLLLAVVLGLIRRVRRKTS